MTNDSEYHKIQRFLNINREIDKTKRLIASYHRLNKSASEIELTLHMLEEKLVSANELAANPAEFTSIQSRFKNLRYQIQVIKDKLIFDSYGNKIDRNQGLILENHIYSDILRDIESSIDWEFIGVSIPTYYYSISSDFDHMPLKNLLNTIHEELADIVDEPKSLLELYQLIKLIQERIIIIANEEYLLNRDMTKRQ